MSCDVFRDMELVKRERPNVQVATNVVPSGPAPLRDFKEKSPLATERRFSECTARGGALAELAGFGALGAPWYVGTLCSSLAAKVDELGLLLSSAEKVKGVTGTVAYQQAKARWDNEMSIFGFNRSDPLLPGTCATVTNELQLLIDALAPRVRAAGGAVPVPTVSSSASPTDLVGTLKTVAIAGAVIAGVVLVAPIVWEIVAAKRAIRNAVGGLGRLSRKKRTAKKRHAAAKRATTEKKRRKKNAGMRKPQYTSYTMWKLNSPDAYD